MNTWQRSRPKPRRAAARSVQPSGVSRPGDPRCWRGFVQASGGSGALSLRTSRQAPDEFAIVGVDHNGRTTVQWRLSLTIMMPVLAGIGALAWSRLTQHVRYIAETSLSLRPSNISRGCWPSRKRTTIPTTYHFIWQSRTGSLVRRSNSSATSGRSNNRSKRGGA